MGVAALGTGFRPMEEAVTSNAWEDARPFLGGARVPMLRCGRLL